MLHGVIDSSKHFSCLKLCNVATTSLVLIFFDHHLSFKGRVSQLKLALEVSVQPKWPQTCDSLLAPAPHVQGFLVVVTVSVLPAFDTSFSSTTQLIVDRSSFHIQLCLF